MRFLNFIFNLIPFKARLKEDGKVPKLMRDLVKEDGSGGGDAELGAGQE